MIALSPRRLTLAAFAVALATIVAAWGFQFIGGFEPCELCYQQRVPYYVGVPILAVAALFWTRLAGPLRLVLVGLAALVFAWGAYLGGFHAGVEWKFWPGPTSCTGLGNGVGFGALSSLDQARVVPCDTPQIRIFALSFAGWNAVLSAGLVLLLGGAFAGLVRRKT